MRSRIVRGVFDYAFGRFDHASTSFDYRLTAIRSRKPRLNVDELPGRRDSFPTPLVNPDQGLPAPRGPEELARPKVAAAVIIVRVETEEAGGVLWTDAVEEAPSPSATASWRTVKEARCRPSSRRISAAMNRGMAASVFIADRRTRRSASPPPRAAATSYVDRKTQPATSGV